MAAARECPLFLGANLMLASANAFAEPPAEARSAAPRLLEINPELRLAKLGDYLPIRRREDLERCGAGLRLAEVSVEGKASPA